jgi:hypothetical protein
MVGRAQAYPINRDRRCFKHQHMHISELAFWYPSEKVCDGGEKTEQKKRRYIYPSSAPSAGSRNISIGSMSHMEFCGKECGHWVYKHSSSPSLFSSQPSLTRSRKISQIRAMSSELTVTSNHGLLARPFNCKSKPSLKIVMS